MQKIIVANWKMNGSLQSLNDLMLLLKGRFHQSRHKIIICPPFPYLLPLKEALDGAPVEVGAQNCYAPVSGAFTGEVSAAMLADIGCCAVIAGHSERRTLFSETDASVKAKASAIHDAGMTAIICVGETLDIKKSGQAVNFVVNQARACLPGSATPENTLFAYEPLWAIGTGVTPSGEEISLMHQSLAAAFPPGIPVLYGGSVTGENAGSILSLPPVKGALVGGASLKAESFAKIIMA